jgi:outer membrane protein assembly factor BamA
VRPIYIGLDEQPPRERVAMMVEVHEGGAKSIDLAAGLETISRAQESAAGSFTRGLQQSIAVTDQSLYGQNASPYLSLPDFLIAMEAAYVDRNLFGRAFELQIPIKYGLSTTEINRYFSFTPTWIDRRFLGSELRFRTTIFGIYDRAFLTLDSLEAGIEFEFSQRLLDRILMALQLEFSGIQTAIPGEKFSPWSQQIKVRPQLALDFLDNPLNPTHGQYISASVSYILENEEGDLRNFFKYDVQFKVFRNIRKSLILGILLRYGQGNSLGGAPLPENERFVLGGNKGVRGYQDDGVRQYNRYGCTQLQASNTDGDVVGLTVNSACGVEGEIPDGYSVRPVFGGDLLVTGSLELRFPILRRSKMWGSLFYDFGALAESLDDLNASSFRQSVGFGFRYLIGGSIPLRLDYGIKVDRRCAAFDTKGICIENESFGNLHLGILYTF